MRDEHIAGSHSLASSLQTNNETHQSRMQCTHISHVAILVECFFILVADDLFPFWLSVFSYGSLMICFIRFIAIMQLVWLCMSQPGKQRDRGARAEVERKVPASAIYTPVILRDLHDLVNAAHQVDAGSNTPEAWHDSLAPLHRHVYAIALIEIGRPFSVFDEMSEAELVVWDYYKMTKYRSDALLLVRFVEVASLDVWIGVWQTIRRAAPGGIFFNMSCHSYNALQFGNQIIVL